MAGLVPAIHVLLPLNSENVDARDEGGHDGLVITRYFPQTARAAATIFAAVGVTNSSSAS
jgi:hypothetical protein